MQNTKFYDYDRKCQLYYFSFNIMLEGMSYSIQSLIPHSYTDKTRFVINHGLFIPNSTFLYWWENIYQLILA